MDDEVEAAERLVNLLEHARDLRVVGDIERQHQRIGQPLGELADVFLEPLALERQRHARPRGVCRPGDGPGDRSLVGDADNQAGLAGEG